RDSQPLNQQNGQIHRSTRHDRFGRLGLLLGEADFRWWQIADGRSPISSQDSDSMQPDYRILFDQMDQQREQSLYSARRILQLVFNRYMPGSVLDVGCGIGTWLAMAKELGISEVRGLEAEWLDRGKLQIASELVSTVELEKGFSLGRRFDLAICLEVAEHLS